MQSSRISIDQDTIKSSHTNVIVLLTQRWMDAQTDRRSQETRFIVLKLFIPSVYVHHLYICTPHHCHTCETVESTLSRKADAKEQDPSRRPPERSRCPSLPRNRPQLHTTLTTTPSANWSSVAIAQLWIVIGQAIPVQPKAFLALKSSSGVPVVHQTPLRCSLQFARIWSLLLTLQSATESPCRQSWRNHPANQRWLHPALQ